MNLTLPGVVLALVLVLPGAIVIWNRKSYFPTRDRNAFDTFIGSVGYSVLVHLGLLLALGAVLPRWTSADEWLTHNWGNKKFSEIENLLASELVMLTILVMAYATMASIAAFVLSSLWYNLRRRFKPVINDDSLPVLVRLFDPKRVNFVQIRLDDGLTYQGKMRFLPGDYDSILAEAKDIALTSASVKDGDKPMELLSERYGSEENYVLINTKNVVSIELIPTDP